MSITNVIAVFIGGDNTFALKSDGSVWAWGLADSGRLGDGGGGDGRTPVQVRNIFNVQQVFAGDTSSMALLADRTLWGWGKNEKGQLGLGNATPLSAPVKLTLPVTEVKGAAAGDSHFIIDPLGRMYGAGSNELGTLGLGDLLETRAPELVAGIGSATAVAASATQSIALRADKSVWVWVRTIRTTSARRIRCRIPSGLSGSFIAIAGGSQNAIAVRDDGAVFGWGKSVPGSSTPSNTTPVVIPALSNVKTAATGGTGVIALTNANRAIIACNGIAPCPGSDFNLASVTAVSADSGTSWCCSRMAPCTAGAPTTRDSWATAPPIHRRRRSRWRAWRTSARSPREPTSRSPC